MGAPDDRGRTSLGELAALFLKLGTIGFGGPAAHVAMIRDEVVTRRAWMSEERFLDLLGATNLIPGPNSTELAIHVGHERRGFPGLVVAGVAFIVPAMAITAAIGAFYARYGEVPEVTWVLYGVKPVILAVVVQAIVGLAKTAARGVPLVALGAASVATVALGVHELAVLFGAGLVAAIARAVASRGSQGPLHSVAPLAVPLAAPVTAAAAATSSVTLPGLFGVFVKIGSVLFGSGYVLLAFLRADFVERLGWMTESQLLDAVAVGQITPGPVFTTATFIGYVLAGPAGALVATAGIFLPAFVFVAASAPLVPRIRASRYAGAFLDGVNVASLALMAVVTFELGRAALVDAVTVVLAVASALLLLRFRTSSLWLVTFGAIAGFAARAAGIGG